ncbi:hypothetical protein Aros01_08635 [Streptosporangium roseum]
MGSLLEGPARREAAVERIEAAREQIERLRERLVAGASLLTSKKYEWIVEGDVKACFDELSHIRLMGPGAGTS